MLPYDYAVLVSLVSIYPPLPANIPNRGISYDIVARPQDYARSYIALAEMFNAQNIKMFQAIPLSTSLIPRHVTIDTVILCKNILGISRPSVSLMKFQYWASVFNLKDHAFKKRSGNKFDGMIRTDGISCSVLIDCTVKRRGPRAGRIHVPAAEPDYFENNLQALKPDMVFIDPNRRDLQYCLGSNGKKIRYTSSQRRSETHAKEHVKIRTKIEVAGGVRGVGPAPPFVPLPPKTTVDLAAFTLYLGNFFQTMPVKEAVYANEVFRKLRFAK